MIIYNWHNVHCLRWAYLEKVSCLCVWLPFKRFLSKQTCMDKDFSFLFFIQFLSQKASGHTEANNNSLFSNIIFYKIRAKTCWLPGWIILYSTLDTFIISTHNFVWVLCVWVKKPRAFCSAKCDLSSVTSPNKSWLSQELS